MFTKGEVCDPKLKSSYKLDNSEAVNGVSNEDLLEVIICREKEIDGDELRSK